MCSGFGFQYVCCLLPETFSRWTWGDGTGPGRGGGYVQVGEGAGPSENGNNALKGGQDAARQNRRRHIGILPYTSIPVPAGVRH